MTASALEPFTLLPELKAKVWGGQRLVPQVRPGPNADLPIGEVWLAHDGSRLETGAHAGRTLGELTRRHGTELVGRAAPRGSFPLLLKLLDTSDWLSVQVHPDDGQARVLEGPEGCGKTECWYFLDADPGAPLLCGIVPGTDRETLLSELGTAAVVGRLTRYLPHPGESMLVRSGTPHALGPGLTLFELQQPSDITYRIYDWDRPAADGRGLHLEASAQVLNLSSAPTMNPPSPGGPLVRCAQFALDLWKGAERPTVCDPGGETFHAVTLLGGQGRLRGDSWSCSLMRHRTTVVPAVCGAYQVDTEGDFQALCARLV